MADLHNSAESTTGHSEKVVCYLVHGEHLLVFTHDDVDLLHTGVQVPAGTVKADESTAAAAVRELVEEAGISAEVRAYLGSEEYDLHPVRDELATRHFYWLHAKAGADLHGLNEQNAGGENDAADGKKRDFTCFWIPISQAHVLAAGFSAKLGALSRMVHDNLPGPN